MPTVFRIIIVPDIGVKPSLLPHQSISPWAWLFEVAVESLVWEFDYTFSEDGPPIWAALLQRSEELLEILLNLETSAEVSSVLGFFHSTLIGIREITARSSLCAMVSVA